MIKKKIVYSPSAINWMLLSTNDILYTSYWLQKIINKLMRKGQKEFISKKIYLLFQQKKLELKQNPKLLLTTSLMKISPILWMTKRKQGKYQRILPITITPFQRYKKALKWLCQAIITNSEQLFENRLFNEILAINTNKHGTCYTYKKNLYTTLVENKAYMRLRWR